MFKENKETPMVVLVVLVIVFSVLSWFRILPGNLAECGMYATLATMTILISIKDLRSGKSKAWMCYVGIIISAMFYVVAVKSLLLTFNM